MRTFLTEKASATFFGNAQCTGRVMKDHLEFIYKVKAGVYAVVLLIPLSQEKVKLMCNWGKYFDKVLFNLPNQQSVFERIKAKCPLTFDLFTKKDGKYRVCSCYLDSGEKVQGIAIDSDYESNIFSGMELLGNRELEQKAFDLYVYSLDIYNEIALNCPIKNWKDSLDEVWQ